MADLTGGMLTDISSIIAAAAALGTAAYGLVDASKALGGGISIAGFGSIRSKVEPLVTAAGGTGAFGKANVIGTLRANWMNGLPKAEQKAVAKSLIRLCLTPANAPGLAGAVGVEPARLKEIAEKIQEGTALTPDDINIFGRFDAVVSALLDEGYERADQIYRSSAKALAAVVAVLLALAACAIIRYNIVPPQVGPSYLVAFLIGLVSTPLAPIAKDLSSALAAAVSAVGSWKR